jgi:hypothetical protein
MVVFPKPKVEVPVRIQSQYRLAEKALKPSQELVDLRELLACVREEILDIQFRKMLPDKDR